MRFNRYGRYEFRDTARKRAAFARKQKAEREAFPLFADQIAEKQIGVDEEMASRWRNWDRQQAKSRQRLAEKWREARRRLRSYPDDERKALLGYWQRCTWPGDPTYLLSMLHMYDTGRLDLNPPTVSEQDFRHEAVQAVIDRLLAKQCESS